MAQTIAELRCQWQQRLDRECPHETDRDRQSILDWLLDENFQQWTNSTQQLAIFNKNIDYRFSILQHRYLNQPPTYAYKNLMCRFSNLPTIRILIASQISPSKESQRTILDAIEQVILDILQHDRDIKHQIEWIARCTDNSQLRDRLLFASLEAYCLQIARPEAVVAVRQARTSGLLPTDC